MCRRLFVASPIRLFGSTSRRLEGSPVVEQAEIAGDNEGDSTGLLSLVLLLFSLLLLLGRLSIWFVARPTDSTQSAEWMLASDKLALACNKSQFTNASWRQNLSFS